MRLFFKALMGTKQGTFWSVFLTLVLLSLLFQVVHFGEHVAQAIAWLAGYRDMPYMSAVGHYLMNLLGVLFYPEAPRGQQMMMGNEILHLFGNFVYAFGTTGMLFFIRSKIVWAAAVIEGFHLYEHLCLTISAAMIGAPIGMSTLWGMSIDPSTSVALRVWWHFFMNAIPTTLSIIVLYSIFKKSKSR